ncbi:MAG TPA: hypothetical protein VK635_34300 [Bradyrhizobium sp.]|nr:hypothetical protein [Bradyrhizobium sp.]
MANSPDVRVRLSAEGQAEVIAAFQKIASEGKKAGTEAGNAFGEMNKQLADVGKTLVGGLGIVLVAEKFKEFFKSTLEGVENMERLSKQTGLSTNAIQGFQRAARETGVSQDAVNAGLEKFTVAVGKAGVGSKQSAGALSDLGISVRDFSKLAPDAQLEKVAQKLGGIADPARRARDEVALFGRAGVELDQALVRVGNEGLSPFIQHLKDLGIYLDTDSIESIKHANESFKNMSDTVKGLATQFLTGLVPGLQAASDELLRATTGPGVSGFKKVGEAIGTVFRGVVLVLEVAGNHIGALAAKTVTYFEGAQKLIAAIPNGIKAVGAAAADTAAKIAAIDEARDEKDAQAGNRFRKAPETAKPVAGGKGGDGADGAAASALAKAQLALDEARLDNELKLYKAQAALVSEADRKSYEDRTISLADFFAKRAQMINAQSDEEISVLQRKRAALKATPTDINDKVGEINKTKELAALDNQIQVQQLARTAELAANTNAQATEQRKLYQDTLKVEEQLLIIAGKKTEAARLKLALDIADLDAQLRKGGASDTDRAAAVGQFASQGGAKNNFDAASTKAQADLQQLTTKEKGLQDQVRDGQTFSINAAQQLIEKQKEMLPTLEADAAAMTKFAAQSEDPALIAAAAAYQQKIDAVKVSTNELGRETQALRQGAEDAIGNGINKLLTDAVSGTHTLKQSFVDMGLAMLQTLEQVIIKQLELKALNAIFGSGFAGGGQASSTDASTAATIGFHASGGVIRGPGTSTSDSIPAMLSDKEFVVNAKSVQQPGILPLLHAINSGGPLRSVNGPMSVPQFAGGGQVSGSARQTHKIVNVLDPSLLGDHLATAAGETSVLNVISRNPNKVRASL